MFDTEAACMAAADVIADATDCGGARPSCLFADPGYLLQASATDCVCLLEVDEEVKCYSDPCAFASPCRNGGTCVANTSCVDTVHNTYCFSCDCSADFAGDLCQEGLK